MLISFSVANFKSIKDRQTLSLRADKDKHLEEENVFQIGKLRLLKVAAIYGPNASGKSNFLEALRWMPEFIISSAREGQAGDAIKVEPFLLNTETEHAPSVFELEFLLDGMIYRYGFVVDQNKVHDEWLFRQKPGFKETALFTREDGKFKLSEKLFPEGKGLEIRTRVNALFLSVCAQFNGPISERILRWFMELKQIPSDHPELHIGLTAVQLLVSKTGSKISQMAQQADFGICKIEGNAKKIAKEMKWEGLTEKELQRQIIKAIHDSEIKTSHRKFDGEGKQIGEVEFDLIKQESEGTKRFVALSGHLLHTKKYGTVLVIDELDSRLHPLLTKAVLGLFLGEENPRNAQLIFATHDVGLMDPDMLRRDQIWFCEKDEKGSTTLYSLAEFDVNQVRPTSKFSRQYMLGIFGAVPHLTFKEAE